MRQRFYSSGPDAEKGPCTRGRYRTHTLHSKVCSGSDGTESLSKLIKLNNGKFSGLYKILCEERILVSELHKLKNKLSGSSLENTNILDKE